MTDHATLLACYRSGQIPEAAWQEHLKDEGLRAYVDAHRAVVRLDPKALAAAAGVLPGFWPGGFEDQTTAPLTMRPNERARSAAGRVVSTYLSAAVPADVAGLVERLRESALGHGPTEGGLRAEAASLIQSQAARIAELEAGMKPFADRYDAWGDAAKGPYTNEDYTPRMVADFARARALLNRRAEG